MKVLDLQCAHGHVFEGWFASEDEFQRQLAARQIECPLCASAEVAKMLSAPRLNLKTAGKAEPAVSAREDLPGASRAKAAESVSMATVPAATLQAAWLQVVRQVVANTEDVGERFAEEARRMHYGEVPERGIRGQATAEQAEALLDEGIGVLSLPMPAGFKPTLQ